MRTKRTEEEKFDSPFAQRLRSLLDQKKMSQAAVANSVGVLRQTVQQYVSGKSVPSYENLIKIANYFEVDAAYLLGATDDPTPKGCEHKILPVRTVTSTWYEAVMARGFGAKLADTFNSMEEVALAIKKGTEREIEMGYKPSRYFIVSCDMARIVDGEGDVVSETITRVRM